MTATVVEFEFVVEATVETIGEITHNLIEVRENKIMPVLEKMKNADYSDDEGIKRAKDDRAGLNKLEKKLKERKKAIEVDFNQPLQNFLSEFNETIKQLDEAKQVSDSFIKRAEQQQRDKRQADILEYWSGKEVSNLVELDKIQQKTWLNASETLTKVKKAIDEVENKINADLQAVQSMYGAELYNIQAFYIECLDLSKSLTHLNTLKANAKRLEEEKARKAKAEQEAREKAEQEAKERAEREAQAKIESEKAKENMNTLYGSNEPKKKVIVTTIATPVVATPLGEVISMPNETHKVVTPIDDVEPSQVFKFKATCTDEQLEILCEFMADNEIKFEVQ